MLGVTAGAMVFPPAGTPGLSAYLTSKIAAAKMLEFLAAENPSLFVASIHPGMIDTEMFRKSGATPEMLPTDSGKLYEVLLRYELRRLRQVFPCLHPLPPGCCNFA